MLRDGNAKICEKKYLEKNHDDMEEFHNEFVKEIMNWFLMITLVEFLWKSLEELWMIPEEYLTKFMGNSWT